MSSRRTERLINLIICLLHTRSFLTAERIRAIVAGYEDAPTDEAFKRAFERDKEDLRDLGIPLETGTNSAFDDEPGYRIARRDYALPAIRLEPDEAAAVGLAARMWSSAAIGSAATRAVRKLEAAGVELTALPEGLQPRVDASGLSFPVLGEAVHDGRVVRFGYRTGASGEESIRTVEPWGLVCWHGRWYLAGHDRDRDATRVFRLSRIVGEPALLGKHGDVRRPDGVDLATLVASYDAARPLLAAKVRVRAGRGHGLRQRATTVEIGADGWDELTVPVRDPERFADLVLPYGADVVVAEPDECVRAVVRRLQALVAS